MNMQHKHKTKLHTTAQTPNEKTTLPTPKQLTAAVNPQDVALPGQREPPPPHRQGDGRQRRHPVAVDDRGAAQVGAAAYLLHLLPL